MPRRPPALLTPDMRAMPVGRLLRVVEEGYGLMPSYAELLSPVERWAVVAYVRALQLSQGADLAALPPAIRAEALRRLGVAPGSARGCSGRAPTRAGGRPCGAWPSPACSGSRCSCSARSPIRARPRSPT